MCVTILCNLIILSLAGVSWTSATNCKVYNTTRYTAWLLHPPRNTLHLRAAGAIVNNCAVCLVLHGYIGEPTVAVCNCVQLCLKLRGYTTFCGTIQVRNQHVLLHICHASTYMLCVPFCDCTDSFKHNNSSLILVRHNFYFSRGWEGKFQNCFYQGVVDKNNC